jgi:3-keto-5-aminohexanoate cleavage enzyme
MGDLIVNFTPTGMIPTKAMTPHVPVSVQEIVDNVLDAHEIGITVVHLHARDPKTGAPSQDAEIYGRIIEGIRAHAPELVLGVSLSGRNVTEFEQRAAPLLLDGNLKPDMGSLTLSSLNFNRQASVNTPDTIMRLAGTMNERGIKPELEAFDVGMLNYAKYLIHKGLLRGPYYVNLLFGNIACAQPSLLHAGMMLHDLPPDTLWAFAGVGDAQVTMNSIAIAYGGGVRVGLEDNIWYDSARTRRATNADLIRRVYVLAEASGRTLMTPAEFRTTMGLRGGGADGYGCA